MIEDAELLRRYAEEKSEAAFAELVQRHLGLVYASALRRVGGDAQLAEDVAQRVFTDVARRAATLARRPVLAGWLFTSARFAASKVMRTTRRRREREQEARIMQELLTDPMAPIDWDEARPVLDDALGELNERDREAILLRYFEGRDFASIGARLGLSDNAAHMRVERALEKLRGRLQRRGITSTAAMIATVLTQQTAVALPAGLATSVTGAALAGAGIASGGFLGGSALIAFMSASKLQLGIAGALIISTAAGFRFESRHIARLESDAANLRHRNASAALLQAENQLLQNVVAEAAALRDDDAALAKLRDEAAALQQTLRKLAQTSAAKRAVASATVPRPAISEKTNAVFQKLKPLQAAQDWPGMLGLLDSLVSEVGPESYDMALILDMKAKLFIMQQQFGNAIEPWEKALELSATHQYFDAKMARNIANILAQLRYQQGLTKNLPPTDWF